MIFIWDENKNRSNLKKHGISFETTSFVFHDPFLLSMPDDRYKYEEQRWQNIGLVGYTAIYVAHTFAEEKQHETEEEIIRIISARAATPSEERRYYYFRRHSQGN